MIIRSLGVLVLAISLAACASTPSVQSDTAVGVNFAAYKSYAWLNTPAPGGMNPIAFDRIRQGVDSAMTAKGYVRGAPADLTVIATVGAKDKTDVTTWGRFGQQVDVYQYTEGKLTVDVFDTRTGKALWHGTATQTIQPDKADPALIDQAVAGLMAQMPARG